MKIVFPLLLAGFALLPGQAPLAQELVFTNATLIDGTGAPPLPAMTVVISGNKIKAVAKTGDIAPPKGAQVVDASGQFLIPGLWDMHVHLSWTKASALPALVANGVTGVRDMGGIQKEIDEWRTKVQASLLTGPRIYRAGPTVNGKEFAYHQTAVTTDAEARAVVRALHKTGVDFIKLHRALPREAYFGLADEAKKLGLAFAGHIPRTVAPEEASDAGQASFEHTETLFEGTFEARVGQAKFLEGLAEFKKSEAAALFARLVKNGTVVDPTLVAYRSGTALRERGADPRDKYVSRSSWEITEKVMEKYKAMKPEVFEGRKKVFREFLEIVGQMSRAGVTLVTGTDIASGFIHPGFSVHEELVLLVEAGLTPMQALQAATRNSARLLKLTDLGVIEAGKLADLVLLEANPLADIRNTQRIRAVVLDGKMLDRRALDKLLLEAESAAKIN